VHEVFQGKTVWDGVVEVFDLLGHQKPNAPTAGAIPKGRTTRASGS